MSQTCGRWTIRNFVRTSPPGMLNKQMPKNVGWTLPDLWTNFLVSPGHFKKNVRHGKTDKNAENGNIQSILFGCMLVF